MSNFNESTKEPKTIAEAVDAAENQVIRAALEEAENDIDKTAELLGLTSDNLRKKIERLGIILTSKG